MRRMPSIPVFRFGRPYESLERVHLTGFGDGPGMAEVSQANPGLIRRDLNRVEAAFRSAQAHSVGRMLDVCAEAAEWFVRGELPVGGDVVHGPSDYIAALSATCGLPEALCRSNMEKIHQGLVHLPAILRGLTRGLEYAVLEEGIGRQGEAWLSYYPDTRCVGVVLPSNSPGVNALWLPAVALRIPVVLKPGSEDPWTPWRILQALLAAGCPPELLAFYPTSHEGAGAVIDGCGRAIIFGDQQTVERYAGDPTVSVHGPGWSKVLVGGDRADQWPTFLDLLADSVALNSGRSCVNASTIVVPPGYGRDIAAALTERLAGWKPLPLQDPDARLAGFTNPAVAEWIDRRLREGLARPGAELIGNGAHRRVVELDGITYLRPCVVYCTDPGHPLARTEFLFPYAAVVEVAPEEMADWIGPSLVVSAITDDPELRAALLRCPGIERLNLGAVPTTAVEWDQPHEGNLFEFLYRRRAIQVA